MCLGWGLSFSAAALPDAAVTVFEVLSAGDKVVLDKLRQAGQDARADPRRVMPLRYLRQGGHDRDRETGRGRERVREREHEHEHERERGGRGREEEGGGIQERSRASVIRACTSAPRLSLSLALSRSRPLFIHPASHPIRSGHAPAWP